VAAEPDGGLITGCELTMAAGEGGSDAENGVRLAAADRFGGAGQEQSAGLEVYGGWHYGSGQARADYQAAGHDTVIKPIPSPLRPAVPGGPGRSPDPQGQARPGPGTAPGLHQIDPLPPARTAAPATSSPGLTTGPGRLSLAKPPRQAGCS
jgi:hypothetical protein